MKKMSFEVPEKFLRELIEEADVDRDSEIGY